MGKDTIVIIGNGFDCWQGLDTSYDSFRRFYLEHQERILKKLRIKKKKMKDTDGTLHHFTDVELIYGNPFSPGELDSAFWNTFEASLDKINASRLNLFFGKEKSGLRSMKKSIKNANRILKEAFCSWIGSVQIDSRDSGFRFGDNCVFVTFNYTDTLEKRFGVDRQDVIHVHGEASDPESIIFGHASHPQTPEKNLGRFGPRFYGLSLVEQVLYQTDKQINTNIVLLAMQLALCGVPAENVKDIYVLGHSLAEVDQDYFAFLKDATSVNPRTSNSEDWKNGSLDPIEELHNRVQYIIKRYGSDPTITEPILPREEAAIRRKLLIENEEQRDAIQKKFGRMLGKSLSLPIGGGPDSGETPPVRTKNAVWHITYRTSKDKERAENLMSLLECREYELLESIDEAFARMRP